jgi:hypothetical protein
MPYLMLNGRRKKKGERIYMKYFFWVNEFMFIYALFTFILDMYFESLQPDASCVLKEFSSISQGKLRNHLKIPHFKS